MSWAGMKKAINRAGVTVMQKTGQVDRTVDREFSDEQARYKIFEKETSALQKETKTHLDSMRAMTASQNRIASTVESFYMDSNSDDAMAAHAYVRAVAEMDNLSSSAQVEGTFRTTVLEPVGKLCAVFPEVNAALSKRDKKALDYDQARHSVRKISDKPSEDPAKLSKAQAEHDEAKAVFDDINSALVQELPQLLDLRIPYLDPSFEAMVRMQVKFAEEGYEKLGAVQRYFPDSVRDEYANGNLDTEVESVLAEMRELSIAGITV